jgi:hypothetical protein
MNEVVNNLAMLVGGNNATNQKKTSRKGRGFHLKGARKAHSTAGEHHGLGASDHAFHHIANGGSSKAEKRVAAPVSAKKAIPLEDDDNDFKEFNS